MHISLGACSGRFPRFDLGGGTEHPAADTRLRLKHLKLDLKIDFELKRLSGRCFATIEATAPGVTEAVFDAVEMDISKVTSAGAGLAFHRSEGKLHVELGSPVAPGSSLTLEIEYATIPRFGFFFLAPDEAYPDRPRQAWSQGQDDYSRYWYPCLDAPNQKATSEILADVPASMEAISNGRLIEKHELSGGRRRFHWRHETPHSPYLVSLVVGEFASWHLEAGGVDFACYVPKGREADGHRAFDNTPEMARFFGELTGETYPYPKYAQVCVADFIFGGMENTSATTLTDRTLHDARAHLDFSSEPLVAHELAHQWFGDLLTCRAWSHGWLNEGFATYFEHLWTERHEGRDEMDAELLATGDGYFDEDGGRYRRPVVETRYLNPSDLFDRHLYNKGAWVLHMLRAELGEEGFRSAIRAYVAANRHANVETVDLSRAVERATGRNFDPFFQQWIFKPGHPELNVRMEWTGDRLRIQVTQAQVPAGSEPPADAPPLFRLTLEVRARGEGYDETRKLSVSQRDQVFEIPLPRAPRWAALDPQGLILMKASIDKPLELWLAELREGPTAIARARAARALGEATAVNAVPALREALLGDPFWAVQAQAAGALGEIRGPAALEALGEGLAVKHPKARRAVVRALGQFRLPRAAELLRTPAASDASYFVEAEALKSLGRTRQPGTRGELIAALPRESFGAVIRALTLEGLAESADTAALPAVQDRLRYGEPVQARVAAVKALGKLGEGKRDALDRLIQLLEDADFYVRLAACEALGELGKREALGPLDRLRRADPSGRVQRAAREATARIDAGKGEPGNLASVRSEVAALRGDVAALRAELADVQAGKAAASRAKPRRPAG